MGDKQPPLLCAMGGPGTVLTAQVTQGAETSETDARAKTLQLSLICTNTINKKRVKPRRVVCDTTVRENFSRRTFRSALKVNKRFAK